MHVHDSVRADAKPLPTWPDTAESEELLINCSSVAHVSDLDHSANACVLLVFSASKSGAIES